MIWLALALAVMNLVGFIGLCIVSGFRIMQVRDDCACIGMLNGRINTTNERFDAHRKGEAWPHKSDHGSD